MRCGTCGDRRVTNASLTDDGATGAGHTGSSFGTPRRDSGIPSLPSSFASPPPHTGLAAATAAPPRTEAALAQEWGCVCSELRERLTSTLPPLLGLAAAQHHPAAIAPPRATSCVSPVAAVLEHQYGLVCGLGGGRGRRLVAVEEAEASARVVVRSIVHEVLQCGPLASHVQQLHADVLSLEDRRAQLEAMLHARDVEIKRLRRPVAGGEETVRPLVPSDSEAETEVMRSAAAAAVQSKTIQQLRALVAAQAAELEHLKGRGGPVGESFRRSRDSSSSSSSSYKAASEPVSAVGDELRQLHEEIAACERLQRSHDVKEGQFRDAIVSRGKLYHL